MILADIKHYLSQRRRVTLADISVHFDTEPGAMRGMLEQWIRKGRVIKQVTSAGCGGSCDKCTTENTEIYQWVDASISSFMGIDIRPEDNGK